MDVARRFRVRGARGFEVLASSSSTPVAAFASDERKLYGVQWHPEVKHSAFGQAVLENFLHRAAGLPGDWNSNNVIEEQVARIREQVGSARVIAGLSAVWTRPSPPHSCTRPSVTS